MPTYRALSVRQPYADWICNPEKLQSVEVPVKDIENRDWPTSYRGLVLIHASKTFEDMALPHWNCVFPRLHEVTGQNKEDYALGTLVGVAKLTDCLLWSTDKWFVGNYGFLFTNIHALKEPIPCKGKLGFFPVTLDIDLEDAKYYV
ncbi:hypothetical protein [Dictyobacter arantiisoli]|uniref:ASCH domain-containing protein n=1 Tax=Dictyobacter arantiisoli TaxID=2014874 RepID=A0A5A5T7W2_9CHLR|nr:hypothetical protein [Dictyobacter arantiisoli]GCF07345.1 hypothetical protein KDI_09090 [Dictyobacter arantiisoli]